MTGPRYTGKGGVVLGVDELRNSPDYVELTDEQLEAAKDMARRRKEVEEEFGPGASVVKPYKPNRHQRRAQMAAKRSK